MKTTRQGAWVHAIGVTTAVGLEAASTAAAVRAGISRHRESPFYTSSGEPMIVAQLADETLPPLAEALTDEPELFELPALRQRMLRLATYALREAASSIAQIDTVPLLLAGPEPYPGETTALDPELLAHLRIQAEVPFRLAESSIAFQGRAGGLAALAAAMQLLHERRLPRVLVGGVDSHVDLQRLSLLDQAGRVQATGVMDGFVPGEGAAFLLLSAQRVLPGSRGFAYVAMPGLGEERGHRYSDEPYLGDGLADAVREALQAAPDTEIRSVLCSLNGESFGAKEWGVAAIRSSASLHPKLRLVHPADCVGDLGAAAGPTLVALAALGLFKGYYAGPSLVWCASERAPRAAVVVSREAPTARPQRG